MLVQALVAPGAEQVLENLFTHSNDHTVRYPVTVRDRSWAEVVTAMMNANLGTALAYVTPDNEVICHPPAERNIEATALIMMVREQDVPAESEVQRALAAG
jgi:voltage-gated potassium channel